VLDRAVTLNPNATGCWQTRGAIQAFRNQPEAAIESLDRAQRLSPFDPLGHYIAFGFASAHFAARRFDRAIEWADRALRDQPHYSPAIWVKIAGNAHLGRLDEAHVALARLRAINPKLTIAGIRAGRHSSHMRLSSSTSMSPACVWPACRRGERRALAVLRG
jgi:tetratricopeptide (TPR) repeat protein